MDQWQPYIDFWAPYLFASGAALFALLTSKTPLTLRVIVGHTGRGGLLGGAIGMFVGPLLPLPEKLVITESKRVIGMAVLLGGGYVKVSDLRTFLPGIRSAILRALGKGGSNDS